MTIFVGADDEHRRPGLWPSEVPLGAPIEQCNRILSDKLIGFSLEVDLPIRMRLMRSQPEDLAGGFSVKYVPADEKQNLALRRLRDRLSRLLGIRGPDHDSYVFHVGFAYQIRWFDHLETADFHRVRADWLSGLARRAPELDLGHPKFCTYEDMFMFRQRVSL